MKRFPLNNVIIQQINPSVKIHIKVYFLLISFDFFNFLIVMLSKKSVHYIQIFMFCLQLKEKGKKFLDCGRGSVKILGLGGRVNIFRTGEVQVLGALSLLGVSTSLHGMKIQLSEDLRLNKKT